MTPVIYKGDDTDFCGKNSLALKLKTQIDLAGCKVEFVFLGQKRTFAGREGMTVLPFVFTAAETATMPVGVHKAKVRVFDTEGRVRTVDEPRIKVTDDIREAYLADGDQEIEVLVGRSTEQISSSDVFDCAVGVTEIKERLAYLWEKCGGMVINRSALDYGRESR